MSAALRLRMTEAEYLEFARAENIRYEYYAGEAFAMSGGSPSHNRITVRTSSLLYAAARAAGCEAFDSNQRVKVERTGLMTYPDASVDCGKPRFENDSLLNPRVLVEVLSPSTERYDRGTKFAHCQKIESLREYVLIAQDQVRIEHYTLQPDGRWLLAVYESRSDMVRLTSVPCDLSLAEIYENVTFE